MAEILDHLGNPLLDQFGGSLPPGFTAWEALLLKSTAVDGSTSWQHLISSIGTGNCPPGTGQPVHIYPENEFMFYQQDMDIGFVEDDYTVTHEEELEFFIDVIEEENPITFEQQDFQIDVES